jgi:hypothetical protein
MEFSNTTGFSLLGCCSSTAATTPYCRWASTPTLRSMLSIIHSSRLAFPVERLCLSGRAFSRTDSSLTQRVPSQVNASSGSHETYCRVRPVLPSHAEIRAGLLLHILSIRSIHHSTELTQVCTRPPVSRAYLHVNILRAACYASVGGK